MRPPVLTLLADVYRWQVTISTHLLSAGGRRTGIKLLLGAQTGFAAWWMVLEGVEPQVSVSLWYMESCPDLRGWCPPFRWSLKMRMGRWTWRRGFFRTGDPNA